MLSGGDNTPHGMSNADTIVHKFDVDALPGETMSEFVTRATKLIIKQFPTSKLHRLPHHVIVFLDYSLDIASDFGNGIVVGGSSTALSYDKKTLVVCFCDHKDDRGDSQRAYTNIRTNSFNSEFGHRDHIGRGGHHTTHGHTVHIGASEFHSHANDHTGHAGRANPIEHTDGHSTHAGLFGHLHVPHIGLHSTPEHADGHSEHHSRTSHANTVLAGSAESGDHSTHAGLFGGHLDFHVPHIIGMHSTAGHADGHSEHHSATGNTNPIFTGPAEHPHTGLFGGHLDFHVPHIGIHSSTGNGDGQHTARSGQHTARSEPGEHHSSILSDIAHTLHL